MSVEFTPVGDRCNLRCTYCYQNAIRESGNDGSGPIDWPAVERALLEEGVPFTVFGGEALLASYETLERVFKFGLDTYGRNSVQTNGSLLTDRHVHLFKQYNASVGFSLDGPEELNDARWIASLEATRAATARSQAALERLLSEQIRCSLIVTLHRLNATHDRLPRLVSWLKRLQSLGLRTVRLHTLEVDDQKTDDELTLTVAEQLYAFTTLAGMERDIGVSFDVTRDMRALLAGQDKQVTCTWTACDPWTTSAVRGVGPDGSRSNCGRISKDGIIWMKAQTPGYERQLVLYATPQEQGGCRGCRFFVACKGQCPGEAIGGDWRSRSSHCEFWMTMLTLVEAEMVEAGQTPVSLSPDLPQIEQYMLDRWRAGHQTSIAEAKQRMQTKTVPGGPVSRPHGDVPHGDHTDQAKAVRQ